MYNIDFNIEKTRSSVIPNIYLKINKKTFEVNETFIPVYLILSLGPVNIKRGVTINLKKSMTDDN